MASVARDSPIERLRLRPLRGGPLVAFGLAVWLAGAFYCSGYERLLTGFDNWPASLLWSAVAVLPWLILFEWSKAATGRLATRRAASLVVMLVATAVISLLLEAAANALTGSRATPIALALLRRLPAIGASTLLILWSRAGIAKPAAPDESLAAISSSIDWIAAADNYVELHAGQRVTMRRMTLRDAEQALAGRGFVRIHRRYLINRRRILSVKGNGDQLVILADGSELPVGRSYAANLDPRS